MSSNTTHSNKDASNGVIKKKEISMNVNYNSLKDNFKKIGYLKKLGGKGISKNWKKRFFVLTKDGLLYYFKHRTSNSAVGCLDLSRYTKIYKDSKKKKNFLLINENNPSERVFHLVSESESEMKEWIDEITEFFEDDISDLKNKLNDLKLKKQGDTIKKTQMKAKRVEEYELDKLQLVLRGGRLSISVRDDGGTSVPELLRVSSTSPTTTTNSPMEVSNSSLGALGSNSFLKLANDLFNQPINSNPQTTTTTTTTTTTSTTTTEFINTTPSIPDQLTKDDSTVNDNNIGFHDDDDDEDDEED
ncbi:hypothetical protein DLAC_00039 [Tieghemostelium lacteum]|uniref:PH domain-containing protein n=1 Tax=Tieghemostelium lacteum TaxID=361077 RepID=A0A152A955_TIELA|nr:hypothetical protein DLAC_00039 [Tieghemostelium lacteum]|eukprot:KYR02597.1 hypothetical protein DLAC_00039 [Tieghemostelium lacteum]